MPPFDNFYQFFIRYQLRRPLHHFFRFTHEKSTFTFIGVVFSIVYFTKSTYFSLLLYTIFQIIWIFLQIFWLLQTQFSHLSSIDFLRFRCFDTLTFWHFFFWRFAKLQGKIMENINERRLRPVFGEKISEFVLKLLENFMWISIFNWHTKIHWIIQRNLCLKSHLSLVSCCEVIFP